MADVDRSGKLLPISRKLGRVQKSNWGGTRVVFLVTLEPVIVAASSPLNDLVSLCNRFLIAFPRGDYSLRELYRNKLREMDRACVTFGHVLPVSTSLLLEGVPKHTRMRILKGIKLCERGEVIRSDLFSFFTKREKLIKATLEPCSNAAVSNTSDQYDDLVLGRRCDPRELCDAAGPTFTVLPRSICFDREDAYVSLKCFLIEFQHRLEEDWDGRNGVLFLAGRNFDEVDDWFNTQVGMDRSILYSDCRNFDRSNHEDFQLGVIDLYRVHGMSPQLLDLRRKQIFGSIRSRHGFVATSDDQIKSGVADTCVGNTMTNVYSLLFCLQMLNPEFTFKQILARVSIAAMGDDNLVFLDRSLRVQGLEALLRRLGLEPKLVVDAELETVTLLNMRPYPVRCATSGFVVTNKWEYLSEYSKYFQVVVVELDLDTYVNRCKTRKHTPLERFIQSRQDLARIAAISKYTQVSDFPEQPVSGVVYYALPASGKTTFCRGHLAYDTDFHPQYTASESVAMARHVTKKGAVRFVFGPKIGRIIMRLTTAVDLPRQVDIRVYFTAVVQGLFEMTHHVPILRVFIQLYLKRFAWDRRFQDSTWYKWNVDRHQRERCFQASTETFEFAARVYGLSGPGDLLRVEQRLQDLKSPNSIMNLDIVNRIIAVDK